MYCKALNILIATLYSTEYTYSTLHAKDLNIVLVNCMVGDIDQLILIGLIITI